MTDNHQFISEGASLIRPPSFTKEYYLYWKDKMEMYIKSIHIEFGLLSPMGIFSFPDLNLNG